jgi:glycosyltransferase involved in cell wall biosynthesis
MNWFFGNMPRAGDKEMFNMRVLMFNRCFPPEIGATGQLLRELCEDLSTNYEVTIVVGRSEPSGKGILPFHVEHHGSLHVFRVGGTRFVKKNLVLRVFNLCTYFVSAFIAGFFAGKADVVVAWTDPPVLGLLGLFFSWWYGGRFIFYCQDLYPDVGVATGKLKNPLLVGFLEKITRLTVKKANHTVVLGEDMKGRILARGVTKSTVSVIPNWADTNGLNVSKGQAQRKLWGLESYFTVVYAGNIGFSQNLEKVLEAAERFLGNKEVRFLFIGEGVNKVRLFELARARSLANVVFLPWQQKEIALGVGDLYLVPLQGGLSGCVVPSKLYSIMAAGKPYIASVDSASEVSRVTKRFGCGLVISPDSVDALVQAIEWALQNRQELRRMGDRGQQAAEREFDRKASTEKFAELLIKG